MAEVKRGGDSSTQNIAAAMLKHNPERAVMDPLVIGAEATLKLTAELKPDTRGKWTASKVAQADGDTTRLLIMDVAKAFGVAVEIRNIAKPGPTVAGNMRQRLKKPLLTKRRR